MVEQENGRARVMKVLGACDVEHDAGSARSPIAPGFDGAIDGPPPVARRGPTARPGGTPSGITTRAAAVRTAWTARRASDSPSGFSFGSHAGERSPHGGWERQQLILCTSFFSLITSPWTDPRPATGPENPILAESRPLIEAHPHWWGPRSGVGIDDATALVSAALHPP